MEEYLDTSPVWSLVTASEVATQTEADTVNPGFDSITSDVTRSTGYPLISDPLISTAKISRLHHGKSTVSPKGDPSNFPTVESGQQLCDSS